jgi:hypothetical protein
MTNRKSTTKGGAKGKGRDSNRKPTAEQLRTFDEVTASRIRAILSDPKTPSSVAGKLQRLLNELGEWTNPYTLESPEFYAEAFTGSAEKVRADRLTDREREHVLPAFEQVTHYAARHEPEGHKFARRVSEIYAEAKARGDREDFIMQAADEVLTSGGECAMLSSPLSAFFVPFFVNAVRDLSPKYRPLAKLKAIVSRYDAGATLREMAEEEEAQGREREGQHKAEELAKPEPKDKLSDEWRYWKLRQVEHAFSEARMTPGGREAYNAAHDYFRGFYSAMR